VEERERWEGGVGGRCGRERLEIGDVSEVEGRRGERG
jgi:hypothetical protein